MLSHELMTHRNERQEGKASGGDTIARQVTSIMHHPSRSSNADCCLLEDTGGVRAICDSVQLSTASSLVKLPRRERRKLSFARTTIVDDPLLLISVAFVTVACSTSSDVVREDHLRSAGDDFMFMRLRRGARKKDSSRSYTRIARTPLSDADRSAFSPSQSQAAQPTSPREGHSSKKTHRRNNILFSG